MDIIGGWLALIVLGLFGSACIVVCGPFLPAVASYFFMNWASLLGKLPVAVWLLTPVITVLLWAVGWYFHQRDAYDGAKPQRGRRVLSGSAARQSAERQLIRHGGPPSKLRTRK